MCFLILVLPWHPIICFVGLASFVPYIPTTSELTPSVVVTAVGPTSARLAPRVGASPAPRALVPFHHEDPSLWPYPRAAGLPRRYRPTRFADTSALSDVDVFERTRQNGKNGGKVLKKNRAREREEIERSWDVPGGVSVNVVNAGSPQQAGLGRPSPVPARTAVPNLLVGRALRLPRSRAFSKSTNPTQHLYR